jgi:dTDP-4-dehydrorhamnose 3,5-epimerase
MLQHTPLSIPGVSVISPKVLGDVRGFFLESYHEARFFEMGIRERFVQDNHSRSVAATIRGLHYQLRFPQAKLCRVVKGAVLDVAVDIRRGSPTFGKWVSAILSAENRKQIFIPTGFAHGFAVLSDEAEFLYKCSEYYHPEDEYGIIWNDPDLGIDWTIREPLLSSKDLGYPTLKQVNPDLLPVYQQQGKDEFK